MKRFLTGVLVLSSLLLLFWSCGSLQGFRREATGQKMFVPVFKKNFNKSLYSVKITFGKNRFTSLAVIKQIPETNSFKLALLTEAGMRLFEMEFMNDGSYRVNYTNDFLNKKKIVKKLGSDFGLLFPGDNPVIKKTYCNKTDSTGYVLRIKKDGLKDYRFASPGTGPVSIAEHGFFFGRTTVLLNNYVEGIPQEISFIHKSLKFEIVLKQINYQGWN